MPTPVLSVLEEVRDLVWEPNKVQSWKQRYQQGLEFVRYTTPLTVNQVTSKTLREYTRKLLNDGKSPATVNKYLGVANQILRTAVEHGYIDGSPRINWLKVRSGRVRVLSDSEERTLMDLMSEHEGTNFYWATMFLAKTGMRPAEVFSLSVESVSTKEAVVFQRAKTKQVVRLPLVTALQGWVYLVLESHRVNQNELLFPIHPKAYSRAWGRCRTVMGLDDDLEFTPYALRHTCASRLAAKGVPLTTIKEWMGHASIDTTMRYVHLVPGALADAARALEDC